MHPIAAPCHSLSIAIGRSKLDMSSCCHQLCLGGWPIGASCYSTQLAPRLLSSSVICCCTADAVREQHSLWHAQGAHDRAGQGRDGDTHHAAGGQRQGFGAPGAVRSCTPVSTSCASPPHMLVTITGRRHTAARGRSTQVSSLAAVVAGSSLAGKRQ